jgi:hypothetical protein
MVFHPISGKQLKKKNFTRNLFKLGFLFQLNPGYRIRAHGDVVCNIILSVKESWCEAGQCWVRMPAIEDWISLPFFINACDGCQLSSHLEITQGIQTRIAGSSDTHPVYRHRLEVERSSRGTAVRCICECTTEDA